MTENISESKTYAKVDLRLIPFLFLCYVLAYIDRVNVGFAKLQMLKDLSLSDAAYAIGAGIFFIGYFLFEVPSNVLLKRFGARIWIARIMILWGIISASTMLVKNEHMFYLMRFLLGVAEAGFFPGIIYYLTLWYPSRMRSSRIAWFVSAVAVAGVIGNPVSGVIMEELTGFMKLAGWQWMFLLEGIPAILVGISVLFYLDSGIAQAKWLTSGEKAMLAANIAAEDAYKTHVRFVDAFKSGKVYILCFIYFTLTIGLYGISFWLPTIVEKFGVKDYIEVGLITAIPYLAAIAGMIFLSRNSDRTGERRIHYALNVLAGSAALVLSGIFESSPVLAMIFLSIAMLGVIGSIPIFWPMPAAFLGGTAAAAGIGIVNSVGNLGGYVGPNIPIWVKSMTGDPYTALYVAAAILATGAITTYCFIPRKISSVTPAA